MIKNNYNTDTDEIFENKIKSNHGNHFKKINKKTSLCSR